MAVAMFAVVTVAALTGHLANAYKIYVVEAYGTQQTQKNTEETRGIRYQP